MKNKNIISFRRIISVLVVVFGIIVTVTSFAGCMNQENTRRIVAIELKTKPYKTSYYVGEYLDLTGLTVNNVYEDGMRDVATDFTTTPAAGEQLTRQGTQTVTIEKVVNKIKRIERHRADFIISVTAAPQD